MCRCGQLKRFVDGNGNITEWQRDEAARVTKKIMPNAAFDLYTCDLSGRLSTEVDAMSRTTTNPYNVDDRLAKKDYDSVRAVRADQTLMAPLRKSLFAIFTLMQDGFFAANASSSAGPS